MSKGGANIAFTVLNIDLNKFKKINDTYGHEAGDAVLKHTAMLLQKSTRSSDFISRMGGDEFIVILPRMHNPDDVEQVIDKIQRSIKTSPLQWQNEEIPLSSSVGFYTFQGKADKSIINEILSKADKSMYQNKDEMRANNQI